MFEDIEILESKFIFLLVLILEFYLLSGYFKKIYE